MLSIVHFSHFVFKCRKHNYFCCDFLLGLLIINLSFVANFVILHIQRFLVITNRDFYGLLLLAGVLKN